MRFSIYPSPSVTRRLFPLLLFVLALLCNTVPPAAAATNQAPGAGGYGSDYGSDFGVGRAGRINGRQPITVIGLHARTVGGTAQPWLGLRFGDALAQRLDAFMGRSLPRTEVTRRLLRGNLRPQEVGGGSSQGLSSSARRALDILRRRTPQQSVNGVELVSTRAVTPTRNAPLQFALFGDVTLNGALTQPNSTLTVQVRVARYNANISEAATPLITLRAAAREWAQLPARTTLAVLDTLSVPINEDERTALLREASPLMPSATPARLAAEQRLGQAMAAAIEAQWLLGQSQLAIAAPEKRALLGRSVQQGTAALAGLRGAAAFPASTQPGERFVFAELRRSAQNWLGAAQATVRASQLSLQSFKSPVLQLSPRRQASSRHRTQPIKPRRSPLRRAP
ncbi:MAG TPA: hypothetical protein VF600_04975 [Abditibacteriaceae bacterium]